MMWTLVGFLMDHWRLALGAVVLDFVLALAYLAAEYLIVPAWRLRNAQRLGPDAVEALIAEERLRLQRVEDEAAILAECGRPAAPEIRGEANLRRLILGAMERRVDGRWP